MGSASLYSLKRDRWGYGYGDNTIKGVDCGGGRLLLPRMAELIACGRVAPEKLITHRFHGMDAMDLFLRHDRSLIKPVSAMMHSSE